MLRTFVVDCRTRLAGSYSSRGKVDNLWNSRVGWGSATVVLGSVSGSSRYLGSPMSSSDITAGAAAVSWSGCVRVQQLNRGFTLPFSQPHAGARIFAKVVCE